MYCGDEDCANLTPCSVHVGVTGMDQVTRILLRSTQPAPAAFRDGCINSAKAVMAKQVATFASEAQEQTECEDFIQWADKCEFVRSVVQEIPFPSLDKSGAKVFIIDFAPKAIKRKGLGDDEIYASNPEVWRNIPRGCAMIKIVTAKGEEVLRWGVRANRKFTGHEDEESSNAHQFLIPTESKEEAWTVATIKENGCVVHIGAREITVDGKLFTVLIVGSKKVHIAVKWVEDDVEFMKNAEMFVDAKRYELARDMLKSVKSYLSTKVVHFLSVNRLVINAEYIVPVGSGPINNRLLHGITQPTPFAFSLVFNTNLSVPGAELCLNPIYAIDLLQSWGWNVVKYFPCRAASLDALKTVICGLPVVEGCVVYHLNPAFETIELEKVKSAGYVVVRAIREKAKAFATAGKYGLEALIHLMNQHATAITITREANGSTMVTVPQYNPECEGGLLKSQLQALKGVPSGTNGWKFPAGVDLDKTAIITQYKAAFPQKVLRNQLGRVQRRTISRIHEIDHVIITQREMWCDKGVQFMQWLYDLIVGGTVTGQDFFDSYSSRWTDFDKDVYTPSPGYEVTYARQNLKNLPKDNLIAEEKR